MDMHDTIYIHPRLHTDSELHRLKWAAFDLGATIRIDPNRLVTTWTIFGLGGEDSDVQALYDLAGVKR